MQYADSSIASTSAEIPVDPNNFEIYSYPQGQWAGASTIIRILRKGVLLGDAQSLLNIPNVSRKYTAYRTRTTAPVKPGDSLVLLVSLYRFHSIIFVDGFGWVGIDAEKTPLTQDTYNMTVVYANGIKMDEDHYLYDQLCLQSA
jgi:hypothetical protein